MNEKATFVLVMAIAASCKGSSTSQQTEADRPQGVAPAAVAQIGKDRMHRHNVLVAALSGDGSRIATGSVGGEVLVWSTKPFVPVRDLPPSANRGKISALALSQDGGEALVAPDWKPAVERWDVAAGTPRSPLAAHTGRTTALVYGPGGIVATGGADRRTPASGGGNDDEVPALAPPTVRLWKGETRVRELTGLKARIGAIAFNHDGSLIAAGGDDAVKVWNTASGAEVASYDLPGESATVAFRGDEVCAVSSTAAACFPKGGAVAGAKAPTRAAAVTPQWIASGTFDAVEVRGADGAVRATIPGRAYAIVGHGDDLWAILADSAVAVTAGVAAPPVAIKVPAK